MKRIPLASTDQHALVDTEDYQRVLAFSRYWQLSSDGSYAQCGIYVQGRHTTTSMHRVVLGLNDSAIETDHINGDGLDNRKSNLRTSDRSGNNRNRNGWGKTSQYKGVRRKEGKWEARIRYNGKLIHIGRFSTEIEAAMAYDERAKELFEEFARPNLKGVE